MARLARRGVLTARDTVRLTEPVELPEGTEVEVLIDTRIAQGSLPIMLETLRKIHADLAVAGHRPPTDEEVIARIEAERRAWERENIEEET
jgi:hypothetical protein